MAIFITVLVIVFLGISYLYVYIPAKERRIREQGFRAMQNIDRNIQAKIQNSVSLLNNILSAYIRKNKTDGDIKNYIENNAFGSFKLTPIVPIKESAFDKLFGPNSDHGYHIQENRFSNQYLLSFYKKQKDKKQNGNKAFMISMEMNVEQFFKPLMPDNVLFDEYIVFDEKKVVYQTFPSGLSEVDPDSLRSTKNGVKGATILKKEIGGTVYQLFLQPVSFTPASSKLIIAGLLANEKYEYEKKQLPSGTVQFLIIVALAIIILFPAIKLYYMGSQDRLTFFDGISAIIISMLLMSLLFFVVFKYNVQFRQLQMADSKNTIAKKIISAFQNEIKLNYQLLQKLDTLALKNNNFRTDIGRIGKEDSSEIVEPEDKARLRNSVDSILNQEKFPKKDFNQVYWLHQSGQEWFKWDSLKYNGPHGNFGQRGYVKNILAKKAYLLNADTTKPYYLEQIISWTTGAFTTVISRESVLSEPKRPVVAAFAFNMKCLDEVVLPAGYTFAIIDGRGKVLYHANKNRNLKENLLQEFSKHRELQSCIEAHAQKSFQTAYMGKDYVVEVKPITGLPYFIAVFSDISFIDTRDVEIYCFTLAMLFAFFCFLMVEMAVVFLVSSQGSYFKKQRFYINWIGPKASFHQYYVLSLVLNIAIVLLLNFAFKVSTFAEFFFMLLFSATAALAFLMCLFANRYRKENEEVLFRIKKKTVWVLLAFIGLINVMAVFILDHTIKFIAFEVVILLLAAALFVFWENWTSKTAEAKAQKVKSPYRMFWDYKHSFTLMVLTRLIITSGIPVVLFYVMAYNYEQNLLIRYRQYDFAKKLIEKEPRNSKSYLNDVENGSRGIYTDNSWIGSISKSTKTDTVNTSCSEENLTVSLLKSFHFYRDSSAIRENHLYQSAAVDSSLFYNQLYKGPLNDTVSTKTLLQNPYGSDYLKVESKSLNYRLPSLFNRGELPFWVLMLFLLLVFYGLILNIIEKLFALNLPVTDVWGAIDREVLLCKDLNKMLMVIGLPGSNKLNYIKEKISNKELKQDDGSDYVYNPNQPEKSNVLLLDLIEIPDDITNLASEDNLRWQETEKAVFSKDYKLVLINHFEYNIKNETTNRIKLNLLERLMVINKCKIIILSTIHPTAFLDSINAQAEQALANASTTATGKTSIQDLERWHILLGNYRLLIHKIEHHNFDDVTEAKSWKKTILKEMQYTHFLHRMQSAAIKASGTISNNQTAGSINSLAFKLQVTAHYFYMYIWQSLTKEEKFLLYDLAEDGLVNSFDSYNLSMLVNKGVIIRDDTTLKLFNRGFRNFILTAIGNTEAMKIKNQMEDNGNWRKLKTPLIVVIFAILAFLLTSQQEAYSKLIAYVSAFAAGIPTLIKLLSMFGNNGAQKSG
ncbi:MAG: cache domain-containing protein [Mucilaginibacter sp.]|uniref:PDC sensor domain-containing protein n=1 Tax=Mucilaginibacter sp. TaxID=1882438 RepID=UPI0034E5A4B8